MPSLLPLLSSGSSPAPAAGPSPPATPKKVPKKLRRRNPPSPSLSTSHQRLPSAGSSTISLPKSRPSSSRSTTSKHGWFAGPATPHPSGDGHKGDWSPEEFPPRPPLPAQPAGMMTPPESGSPELRMARNLHEQQHGRSMSTSLVATAETPRQTERRGSLVPAPSEPPPQQTQRRPPNLLLKKNGREVFKAFSYDMCSSMPVSPPPTSQPPGSVQPSYLGTAQYPNNLLQQAQPDMPPTLRLGPPIKAQSFPTPLDTNVPPITPAQQRLVGGRTPNGSPILPPLPSFQSGGFGFDNPNEPYSKPKPSPTYPGRSKYKPVSFSGAPEPSKNAPVPPRWSQQVLPPQSQQVEEPQEVRESEADEVAPEPMSFHAITAEEPIVLPSSSETSPQSSPELKGAEFSEPPPKPRGSTKPNERSSFLGGWKLALINSRGASASPEDEKAASPDGDAPVGVGDGGGWIHKRKGSFSSTRPPSAEKSKHKQFGQEYKEFRAQKKAGSAASSKRTSRENSAPTSPAEGTGVSAILGGAGSSKHGSGEKMRSSEARQMRREDESGVEANEIVGLDVAVKQMNLLEQQLRSGQPLSPPDSRDGETPSVELDKGYLAGSEQSRTSQSSSAASSSVPSPIENQKGQNPVLGPPPAHKKNGSKGKSRSPLRHEIDSSSAPSSPLAPAPPASAQKGKGKEVDGKRVQESSKSSSRHYSNSQYPPPSDYLGQPKNSGAPAGNGSPAAGPPAPSKPIAKLFVICCRCKYWHDLPSIMYRAMVENGGATRYTCVVYMHQKHHGLDV
ncbi:unnamed protein product [Tuber aestivum]|uniref:Uncharacterized protein n=1 Tax=Tuber aestivum TaxID=59557 RepID=A0A292PY38_9PEZI|nr:unnamed protein product [Tuber aestivum]